MKLLSTIFIIALSCSFAFAEPALPPAIIVSASVLLENGKTWNDKQVTISGELIGEPMQRGNQVWVNILCQDGNAIGIVTDISKLKGNLIYGNYKQHGSKVLVVGVFSQFAKQYSGETCISANKITLLEEGYETPHPYSMLKAEIVIGLFLLTLLLAIAWWLVNRKQNK